MQATTQVLYASCKVRSVQNLQKVEKLVVVREYCCLSTSLCIVSDHDMQSFHSVEFYTLLVWT